MVAFANTQMAIFLGSSDVSGFCNQIDVDSSAEEKEYTTFASGGWKQKLGGLATAMVDVQGFQSFATGDPGLVLAIAQLRGTQPYGVAIPGTAAGDQAFLGQGMLKSVPPFSGSIGDLAALRLGLSGSTPMADGQVAAPSTARTSTANGTVLTMTGPTAAQRVYAGLYVFAGSGTTPTLDVIVQSATTGGFGSPTTRITFSQVTGAGSPQAQFSSAAGAITDGFWRAGWTIAGGTPSFTFAVLVGIA